jgi:hypothetical protein
MPDNVFTGSGATTVGDATRTLSVQGAFFNAAPLAPGAHPAAVGGQFGVDGGATYRANGIFVGNRQ